MSKRITHLPEKKLIEEMKAQSRIGAEALYDMYSRSLFGVLLKIVNDDYLAEDLLQQSFIKIWYSVANYNDTRGRLFTWMIAITRNMARDCLRSKTYHQGL